MTRVAALTALVVLASCAGTDLRRRNVAVEELADRARDNGARRCAPVELAKADAHSDFAAQELDDGRYYAAREQVELGERYARAAFDGSPPERCVQQPPQQQAAPSDADGDGLLDDADECPRRPEDLDGFQDDDGCPDDDNDMDGIVDAADRCPEFAEDKDGFDDADGCPDPDNDSDGFADAIDQCPNDAEDLDGFQDDDGCADCDNDSDGVLECPEVVDRCPGEAASTPDGCPKYDLVVVTAERIELKQTVFFDTGLATLQRVSYPLLDEVAKAMQDHPEIEVSIEGHTDSRGDTNRNQSLSEARVSSVRDYLVAQGVSGARMVNKGFGEDVPIADNRTKAGRDLNRRVEFVIIRR